jgi:hypothetical protein
MDTSFKCYQEYLALKAHFERDDYDYFKFHGKTNARPSSFDKRKDRFYFAKLVKNPNYKKILLANHIDNGSSWIGDLTSSAAEEVYLKWCKRIDSLGYTFTQDLKKLEDDFNSNLLVPPNEHPRLLVLYLQNDICIETLIILNELVRFLPMWNKQITDRYIWPPIAKKMAKYRGFLEYDFDKMKAITLRRFS